MRTKIIEATNQFNWGKFMVMQPDEEWSVQSKVDPGRPLLHSIGWGGNTIWVLDLQTGEGAMFQPGGVAEIDLNRKHQVWVCPMYEPFLVWLYRQNLADVRKLPDLVELDPKETARHTSMTGYRRKGDLIKKEGPR